MSSGSLLRGHLRPAGARGPPLLIIGLLIVVGVLGFNYWNLSSEYGALLKELSDLQDHLRMAVLKKENAERQYEALERRFHDSEDQLGKAKIAAEQQQNDFSRVSDKLEAKLEELNKVKDQLSACQDVNGKFEVSKGQLEDVQKKYLTLESEKDRISQDNQKMITVIRDLKNKLEEMAFNQARMGFARTGSRPSYIKPAYSNDTNIRDETHKNRNTVNLTDVSDSNNGQTNFTNKTNIQEQQNGSNAVEIDKLAEKIDIAPDNMPKNENDVAIANDNKTYVQISEEKVPAEQKQNSDFEDGIEPIEKADLADNSSEMDKPFAQFNSSQKIIYEKNSENNKQGDHSLNSMENAINKVAQENSSVHVDTSHKTGNESQLEFISNQFQRKTNVELSDGKPLIFQPKPKLYTAATEDLGLKPELINNTEDNVVN